ncbi:hypothetical protein VIBRN418_03566 [Vibrio sp. N418]|uniref:Uncharacterized protein n=1 Tax=Vibrio scophthalmi LMG 19158 TaxID=870967 RepID=F9RM74_9VIBR|nr:hypothetical protein VIBRN418_03566 [Vibrio sp. N418]EGU38601.1 hypothetical protein VIS19158_21813 [Vibrio scophthalmi LMG 19158]
MVIAIKIMAYYIPKTGRDACIKQQESNKRSAARLHQVVSIIIKVTIENRLIYLYLVKT